MARPSASDRRAPIDTGRRTPVGLAVISYADGYAVCSCGQPFVQPREKVREDAIDKHLTKKHNGRGIRT